MSKRRPFAFLSLGLVGAGGVLSADSWFAIGGAFGRIGRDDETASEARRSDLAFFRSALFGANGLRPDEGAEEDSMSVDEGRASSNARKAGAASCASVAALGFLITVLGFSLAVLAGAPAAAWAADAEDDDLVVLLHGLGRSRNNMLILEWRLERMGHRVCNIGYDTRVARIEEAAASVRASIEACRREREGRLHFVTHSLGGLVLRALLSEDAPKALGRAVMLAPPNQGSEIADHLEEFGWLGTVMGPLAPQLGTGPEDLPRTLPVPPLPFGVIAGDDWINPAGPLWLPAPHDGTVSVESTRLTGMRDHIVLPYTHTFIVSAGPVADQVDRFLRRGAFAHAPADGADRGL